MWWSLFLFADLLLPFFFEGSRDAAWWMLLICCCITLEEKLFFHDTPPGKSGRLCLGMALFLFLLFLLLLLRPLQGFFPYSGLFSSDSLCFQTDLTTQRVF